ncbi:MAG: ATP-binding protein [Ramlibacter sp.]|uniref:sensor histidine kinase n=1 Tax=Ramlibacter sp. TaxID=1917967 RepID=UPI00262956BE|nr:ATP-binding protein [Ramlibacter sp.]MDH4374717.1 ATP-binding protein [Ramlibacter sp.]
MLRALTALPAFALPLGARLARLAREAPAVGLQALACLAVGWAAHALTTLYLGRAQEQELHQSASIVAREVNQELTALQTRTLVTGTRLADRAADFPALGRELVEQFPHVARIELRSAEGALISSFDSGDTRNERALLPPSQLIYFAAANREGAIIYAPSRLETSAQSRRCYLDMFTPGSAGQGRALVVTLSSSDLLATALARPATAAALGPKFGFAGCDAAAESADSGEAGFAETIDITRNDLKLRLVARAGAAIGGPMGLLAWVIAIFAAALTGLGLAYEQARRARQRARQSYRLLEEKMQNELRFVSLGQMSTTIAHELNQPLSAIESYAFGCENLLQQQPMPVPQVGEALREIRQQAQRSADIVRSIRAFVSHKESAPELLSLDDLLEELRPLIQLQASDLECSVEIAHVPGIDLRVNRTLLGQVILNLSRNGFEAMAELHRKSRKTNLLRIEATRQTGPTGEHASIRITDNGPGVSDAAAPSIFKPFFSTKKSGMGIGLGLCLSIIERQGGTIRWQNEAGGGSTFVLELPLAQTDH